MAYRGPSSSRSRYFISGEAGRSDSIELFHPIGPVLLPSGGGRDIGSRAREKDKERRGGGERNAEKTTRTRTKGRIKKNKKKPLDVFYTSSGYCIRIYYNLRIPEEEKDCGGGRGGGHTVSTEERWTRKER